MNIDSDVLEFFAILSLDYYNFSLEELVYRYNSLLVKVIYEEKVDVSYLNFIVLCFAKVLSEFSKVKSLSPSVIQRFTLEQYYSLNLFSDVKRKFNESEKLYLFSFAIVQQLYKQNLDVFCSNLIMSMYENSCFVYLLWNGYDVSPVDCDVTVSKKCLKGK